MRYVNTTYLPCARARRSVFSRVQTVKKNNSASHDEKTVNPLSRESPPVGPALPPDLKKSSRARSAEDGDLRTERSEGSGFRSRLSSRSTPHSRSLSTRPDLLVRFPRRTINLGGENIYATPRQCGTKRLAKSAERSLITATLEECGRGTWRAGKGKG